jgi:endonuclease G, mitochondrial
MAERSAGARQSGKPSDELMESLKRYVRTKGADYLRHNNITSVGVGYKQKDGKPTKQVAIQFTVGRKAAPEELAALDTVPIPESIVIDGVTVPTDVVQRTYEPSYKRVPERVANPRKTRVDPIVPGVSVGHTSVSAGTVGCIVFDRHDGTPYILSNWHVLHGPTGDIGDPIVQPGPHDDNRTRRNRIGTLRRSHIGEAGDCAVASIEGRSFKREVLDLGVTIDEIGEPDLGDTVIKSGRTTGVTHGIVTRVHTIAKIDYDPPVGERSVGAFEIGVDDERPPANGEVSMGGDSGAAWLFKGANGKPTAIMAGLHFAGEGSGDPNEHALACYPRSVFEKLEITLRARPQLQAASAGYDPDFLPGHRVGLPKLSDARAEDAFAANGSEVVAHTHFSLAQSKSRRFPIWVAWNIDGGRIRRFGRNGLRFQLDPLVPPEFQVDDDLYAGNRLDRGHVARRADLVWGADAEAKRANKESFYFTNITPQMDDFNQTGLGGIWGRLEDAVFEEVDVEDLRVSVVGGPVFHDDDRTFRGVKVPREFYKVLAYVEDGALEARAFLLTQSLDELEILDLSQFKVFQVSLAEVEHRCGFTFPANLKEGDSFAEHLERHPEAVRARRPLEALGDIRWSRARAR